MPNSPPTFLLDPDYPDGAEPSQNDGECTTKDS